MITLTDTAARKVKELLEAEGATDLALRVAVRPGGCSGFSYEMFFDGDVAADDEKAEFGTDDSRSGRRRPGVGAAARGRHARLQGRPQPGWLRDHEPERHRAPAAAARASADRLIALGAARPRRSFSGCEQQVDSLVELARVPDRRRADRRSTPSVEQK